MENEQPEHWQSVLEKLHQDSAFGGVYHDLLALTASAVLNDSSTSESAKPIASTLEDQARTLLKDSSFADKKYFRLGFKKLKHAFSEATVSTAAFFHENGADTKEKSNDLLKSTLLQAIKDSNPQESFLLAPYLLKEAEIEPLFSGMYVVRVPLEVIKRLRRNATAFFTLASISDAPDHSKLGFMVIANDSEFDQDTLKAIVKHELHHLFLALLQSTSLRRVPPLTIEDSKTDATVLEKNAQAQQKGTQLNNPFANRNFQREEVYQELSTAFNVFRNELIAYMLNQEDALYGLAQFANLDLDNTYDQEKVITSLLPANFKSYFRNFREIKQLALDCTRSVQQYLNLVQEIKMKPETSTTSQLSILKDVMSSHNFVELTGKLDQRAVELELLNTHFNH